MSKVKIIPVDIFCRQVIVFIGSENDLLEYTKKNIKYEDLKRSILYYLENQYDSQETAEGYCYSNNGGHCLIHLYKMPESPKEISIASHECVHATCRILDAIGVSYKTNESDGNEVFAYLQEYLLLNTITKKGYTNIQRNNKRK